jgi:hypothetical protein
LGDLLGDDCRFVHVEFVLPQMYVRVQRHAFAQTGHDGQLRGLHASSHEQDHVFVSRLAKRRHLVPELLQSLFVLQVAHVEHFDGDVSVPATPVHRTETPGAYHFAYLELLERYVPLSHRHAVLSWPSVSICDGLGVRDLAILRVHPHGSLIRVGAGAAGHRSGAVALARLLRSYVVMVCVYDVNFVRNFVRFAVDYIWKNLR